VNTLRVGLFTECYRPIQNGVVASVDALAQAIRACGHEALCVTPNMPGYHEAHEFVVRIPSLPLPTRTAYRLTLPFVTNERVAHALARLSVVHAHSPFVTGWMGARLARRLRVPLVFTYHTQLEEYAHYFPFESNVTRNAASQLTRRYANGADAVIVPTEAMERHLRDLGVATRIEIVPSGIDVGLFSAGRRREDLRARLGVPDGVKMVVSVGRLGREKNVELALEAFARLEGPAHFVIVGDGPRRESLERMTQRAGLAARTTFAGEFDRSALPDVYASADALIFTSTSETQGLVLVEALATGLPVVAVDSPQTRDVLGEFGAVAAADPAALAAALAQTLARDLNRARISQVTAERFDGRILANRVLEIYADLTSSAPALAVS
jgi:glycosyltransferase involved in cell wall biosynthesis